MGRLIAVTAQPVCQTASYQGSNEPRPLGNDEMTMEVLTADSPPMERGLIYYLVAGIPRERPINRRRGRESVLSGEGLLVMQFDLGFRCVVICVWAVEAHASGSPGLVNVGTQHIPALAQMQHPVMPLCRPTLGCDSNPIFLGHLPHSLSRSLRSRSQATQKSVIGTEPTLAYGWLWPRGTRSPESELAARPVPKLGRRSVGVTSFRADQAIYGGPCASAAAAYGGHSGPLPSPLHLLS
jgi:hypothetical protein